MNFPEGSPKTAFPILLEKGEPETAVMDPVFGLNLYISRFAPTGIYTK